MPGRITAWWRLLGSTLGRSTLGPMARTPALICQGCGLAIPGDTPALFRCPEADRDGGDHIVGRSLVASRFPLDDSPTPSSDNGLTIEGGETLA